MDLETLPTRDRLVRVAATLFQQQGYHGTGLAEILSASNVPKGSLYHHFPKGKTDLAIAAAEWASDEMVAVVEASFENATSFQNGLTTLFFKLAKLFEVSPIARGCPVTSMLDQGTGPSEFDTLVCEVFDRWSDTVIHSGLRLGAPEDEVRAKTERAMILIQGAWVMARARNSAEPIRAAARAL